MTFHPGSDDNSVDFDARLPPRNGKGDFVAACLLQKPRRGQGEDKHFHVCRVLRGPRASDHGWDTIRVPGNLPRKVMARNDMNTTQLFVELLVIGMGSAVWISLLAGIFTGSQTYLAEFWSDKLFFLPLVAAAYAIGIVLDRIAWSVFSPLERRIESEYIGELKLPDGWPERTVMNEGEVLAKELYYNRSRLRICRSWLLNGVLITLSFLVSGGVKHRLSYAQSLAVGLAGATFIGASFWALRHFMRDYYRNLRCSYEFLQRRPAGSAALGPFHKEEGRRPDEEKNG